MELAAFILVVVSIFVKDLLNCLPWLCRRIAVWRAKRINEEYRERILQDFLADLHFMESRIGQVVLVVGFLFQDWSEVPTAVSQSPRELVEKDKEEELPLLWHQSCRKSRLQDWPEISSIDTVSRNSQKLIEKDKKEGKIQ